VSLFGPDFEFLRLLALEGTGSGATSLLNRSEAMPCIAVHEVPHKPAREVDDEVAVPDLAVLPYTPCVSPARCECLADATLEGCLLGIGDAERDPRGVGIGETMRLADAVAGSKVVSSPSSSPDMRRAALGRSKEVAGVEVVREDVR